jgi:glycine oxidase
MLAPLTEAWPGEEDLLGLNEKSLASWPEFAAELERAAGRPAGLRPEGTVVAAVDSADVGHLDRIADYLAAAGRAVERLTARQLRALEPAIGPAVRGGLSVPSDLAVDNRRLLDALHHAGDRAGVVIRQTAVRTVASGTVHLDDDSTIPCDIAVICAGARSADLHAALGGLIRPVKGEILRLRSRPGRLPLPMRTVRGLVEGHPVYLVPRDDGRVVLGATQYEAGFDTDVTVESVRDLLLRAERVVPSLADCAIDEFQAGLRPATADNLPLIGWIEPGVLAATGHFRNGILLSPITASIVAAALDGELPPTELDPTRFSGNKGAP